MREDRQKLREAALAAMDATSAKRGWELQTSNSFRRIGTNGDGDVLCATTHRYDGHPDLHARREVLDYIVAAQPHVVLTLLDALDALDDLLARIHGDGGHYIEEHGMNKAVADADAKVVRWLSMARVRCDNEEPTR